MTPLSGPDAVVVDWPPEAPAKRGAEQWAVYLAMGPEGDPALTEAADFLTLMSAPGWQPEPLMFVDLLRVTHDCV